MRTAKEACNSMDRAFNVAFKGGIVLGFTLVGLALLVLLLLIMYYQNTVFNQTDFKTKEELRHY